MERLMVLDRQISSQIVPEYGESTMVQLNNHSKLNALTYEMFSSVITLARQHPTSPLVLYSDLAKAFSAGGDLQASVGRPLYNTEFYSRQLTSMWEVSKNHRSVSLIRGITLGAGAGLAMSCKFRVAFKSTRFGMPENSIGLTPDVGSNYYLTHLRNPNIGLYLSLTGEMISGADAYWAGLATHYVDDSQFASLLAELKLGGDVENTIKKYESQPDGVKLIQMEEEINRMFGNANSVEEIVQRLEENKSSFAQKCKRKILDNCPLSVKVAFALFQTGRNLSYKECLGQCYNVDVQLCLRRCYNYHTGTKHKVFEKKKTRPQWEPNTLPEVTPEMVNTVTTNPEGPILLLR